MTTKLSREQFEAEVRAIGAEQYHNNHPYHHRMYQGQCSIDEIRAWALNRFCYQRIIPVKDALIMARIDDIEDRREWRQRIVDHDGEIDDHPEGGLRRWLALTSQLGFSKEYVMSMQGALPATKSHRTPILPLFKNTQCSRPLPPRSQNCFHRILLPNVFRACSRTMTSLQKRV